MKCFSKDNEKLLLFRDILHTQSIAKLASDVFVYEGYYMFIIKMVNNDSAFQKLLKKFKGIIFIKN